MESRHSEFFGNNGKTDNLTWRWLGRRGARRATAFRWAPKNCNMKITSQNRKIIIFSISLLLVFLSVFTYRHELINYYYIQKYSDQTEYAKSVIQSITHDSNDNYKNYFIKGSWFLSHPEYIKQAREVFREIDTKSFAPVWVNHAIEDGFEVLFISLSTKDKDNIKFKLKKEHGGWIVVSIHGDP